MSDQPKPLEVLYFSDVMCVWAYAGQVRIDELLEHFGPKIHVEYRFLNIYGDVPRRIQEHCGSSDDPQAAYASKMRGVAARFEHTRMHDDVFAKVVPPSSNQSHLVLCGVRELIARGELEDPRDDLVGRVLCRVRSDFFERARDIGQLGVLFGALEEEGIPVGPIEGSLKDGTAMARLSQDLMQKDKLGIAGSPTYVLDGGREKLFGNVGYRIIEANVSELLEAESGVAARGASWC